MRFLKVLTVLTLVNQGIISAEIALEARTSGASTNPLPRVERQEQAPPAAPDKVLSEQTRASTLDVSALYIGVGCIGIIAALGFYQITKAPGQLPTPAQESHFAHLRNISWALTTLGGASLAIGLDQIYRAYLRKTER